MPRRKTARAPQSAIPNEIIIEQHIWARRNHHHPFIVVALLKSYGITGVLSLMIGLLIVQIFVVSFFGVEPRKRRLEELDSSIPRSHFSENPALAIVAKK
jgi:hypothetical protein